MILKIALIDELNAETETVTGIQFVETATESFKYEMHFFDNITPSDDIPNHLLLLYLNCGLFLFATGLLMIFRTNKLKAVCISLSIFGSSNIIFQV